MVWACPRHWPPPGIEPDHRKSGGGSGQEGRRDAAGQSSAGPRFASGEHASPQDRQLPDTAETEARPHGAAAENARRRLRSMMRPGEAAGNAAPKTFIAGSVYSRLRDTALTGNPAFFHTALADLLEIDFATLRRMVGTSSYTGLLAAMRVLDLSDEQAFMIAAATCPSQFSRPEAIRLFLSRYRLLHRDCRARSPQELEGRTCLARSRRRRHAPEAQPTHGTMPRPSLRNSDQGVGIEISSSIGDWPGSISTTQISGSKRFSFSSRASTAASSSPTSKREKCRSSGFAVS